MEKLYCSLDTTIFGTIYIVAMNNKVIDISLSKDDWESYYNKNEVSYVPEQPILLEAVRQLEEYFEKKRRGFQLPLEVMGTSFQQKVWETLQTIPYGQTCSYLDIANQIENPKAVRAVGQANRKNPIPIIIPCHRVIGKNKSLTGYSGTRVDLKEKLLDLEGAL